LPAACYLFPVAYCLLPWNACNVLKAFSASLWIPSFNDLSFSHLYTRCIKIEAMHDFSENYVMKSRLCMILKNAV